MTSNDDMPENAPTPRPRGRPKGKKRGRKKGPPKPIILDENGVPLSQKRLNQLEIERKKLEARKAYEERKQRDEYESSLTPIEKEALKLLREEERLKQAEARANEEARKETIRNEKVSMEMSRIKAEETRQKIEQKPLSLAQLTKLFFTPCATRADLKAWIKYFLGLDLPDCTVSRYADSNPLDIIWEIYRICVHKKNTENVEELLVVASRGAGKCVEKGTLITTSHGPKAIENVKVGDSVWTGMSWQPVTCTFDEGVKAGVKIATNKYSKDGGSLAGSLKHRVQALHPETGKIDWVFMKDLVPGQIIYKTAEPVYGGQIDTSSKEYIDGWLVGAITGDGCLHRSTKGNVSLCSGDFKTLRFFANEVGKRFNVKGIVKRNSRRSATVTFRSVEFKQWFKSYVDGDLSYFKKLKTLEHSPDFLSGFIAGLMDTDGSKDSITLANPDLINQIQQILTSFGIHCVVNNKRRKPSTTKYVPGYIVTYHEAKYFALPDEMLPLFSKRQVFIDFKKQCNEQHRYPSKLILAFGNFIKEKYEIGGGYWRLEKHEKKTHSNIKYANELWGNDYDGHIYGHKIDYFIKLAERLYEFEWADYLRFIRNGHYETIKTVTFDDFYFHDLEVDVDHAYTSSGFVSHNTLSVAVVEFLLLFHDQRDVAHIGAILSQAKRCYEYQTGFLLNEKVKQILDQQINNKPIIEKMTQEKSLFNVKDRLNGEIIRVGIEVLPCTLKAVNGAHVAFVSVDEIDTVSGEGLVAYRDISGVLDSKRGRKALRVGISTRKSRYGLMNRQIEEAEKAGRTVRKWTVLEFSQKCDDARSGRIPTDAYINQDTLEVLLPKDFDKLDKRKKGEFELNHFPGDRCTACAIAALCRGDAKLQKSTSTMLKPISDAIKKTRENNPDWAISQLFNLKPSVEGIIFKEFDEKVHVQDWNGMWEILTGMSYPGVCTHDIFVKKCHSMNLPSYGGMDFGWSSPAAYVVFFVDNRENVYVVRTEARTYVSNPNWIQTIKMKWHPIYRSQLYFPDCANPGDIQMCRQEGLPVPTNQIKDIQGGIQVIKKWLRSLASPTPKFYVAKETNAFLIEEFKLYHFKTDTAGVVTDDPEDENNHACFVPGTLVHTIDGMMPIEQIVPGIKVLNRLGEYRPVLNLMSCQYSGEITKSNFFCREQIISTPEHPFYIKTLDRARHIENGKKLSGQLRPIGSAVYVPIGQLKANKQKLKGVLRYASLMPKRIEEKDYVIDFMEYLNKYQPKDRNSYIPHTHDNTKMVSRSGKIRNRYYKVDKDFAFLMGYYLAEGNRSGSIAQLNGISLAGHVKEVNVGKLIRRVSETLDGGTGVTVKQKVGTNGRSFKINSVKLAAFFLPCSKGTEKKPHGFIPTLPLELREWVLAGYMFGDGCFTGGTARGCSISRHIAYEMFSIMNDLGYRPNIKLSQRSKQKWANKPGRITVTKDQYKFGLSIEDTNDLLDRWLSDPELAYIFKDKRIERKTCFMPSHKGFKDEEGSWKNLKDINNEQYTGLVYNLEMDGDPSYVVHGMTVHNCDAIRYAMYGLFSKSRSVMSSSDSEFDVESVVTENGFLKKAPSVVEFAAMNNISISTEVIDPKSIGKMVRASDMAAQQEENEEGMGGSGSFLFSF